MSHTKRVTRDNRKNSEYHVAPAIRKLRTDTNCAAGKSWPNHVKNEQHIGSEKTYGPKKYLRQWNMMMQRTANENAACERRICKRSDQPKIESISRDQEFRTSGFTAHAYLDLHGV